MPGITGIISAVVIFGILYVENLVYVTVWSYTLTYRSRRKLLNENFFLAVPMTAVAWVWFTARTLLQIDSTQHPIISAAPGLVVIGICCFLFFKGSRLKQLIMYGFSLLIVGAMESLIIYLFGAVLPWENGTEAQVAMLLTLAMFVARVIALIIVLATRTVWRSFFLQEAIARTDLIMLLIMIVITISGVAFTTFGTNYLRGSFAYGLFLPVSYLTISIVVFALFSSIQKREKLLREIALQKQQAELQLESIQFQVTAQLERDKALHESLNFLRTLSMLLEEGNIETAQDYLSRFIQVSSKKTHRLRTGNEMLNAILNLKDNEAKAAGIQIDFQIHDMKDYPLNDNDTISVFGNILDNAIEANALVEDGKEISVNMNAEGSRYIISVGNTAAREVEVNENRVRTTKKDRAAHGHGLQIVAEALGKYGGHYELSSESDWFQFVASVPVAQ